MPYNSSIHVFLNLSALWLLQYSNFYLEWIARVLHGIKSLPQPADSNSYTAFVHCCIEYIFCKRKHNHIILELHYIILGFFLFFFFKLKIVMFARPPKLSQVLKICRDLKCNDKNIWHNTVQRLKVQWQKHLI